MQSQKLCSTCPNSNSRGRPNAKLFLIIGVAVSISFCFAKSANAQLAVDFTGNTQNGFQADLTFGYSFRVSDSIVVDQLGMFDDFLGNGAVGLQQSHEVRIWTDDNVSPIELVVATIFDAGTTVASTAENGQWLMVDIPGLTLTTGDYVISAHDPACTGPDCDRFRFAAMATTVPQVELLQPRFANGNNYPNAPQDQEGGYFGPTFREIVAVPEPTTAGLLLGVSTIGLVIRRKR